MSLVESKKLERDKKGKIVLLEFEKRHLEQGLGYFDRMLKKQIKKFTSKLMLLKDLHIILAYMFLEKNNTEQAFYLKQGLSDLAVDNYRHSLPINPVNHALVQKLKHRMREIFMPNV